MKNLTAFFLTLFVLCNPGWQPLSRAQGILNKRQVQVMDSINRAPVEGATIRFLPSNHTVSSDEGGRFLLPILFEFDSIEISAIGYSTKRIDAPQCLVAERQVYLSPGVVELKELVLAMVPGDAHRTINKLDLALRPVANSQEVLRMIPGLFISQHAGGGKAEQIYLRGFDLDHGTDINISVDGRPVNMVSHAHGQGYADLHFLIPELIEGVTFQKGPYEAEKGNLATAGSVDFRTKNILRENKIKLEAGRFNSYRSLVMLNLLPGKWEDKGQHAFVASEYMFTNGYFDHPQDFNRLNFFGKYHGKLGERNQLTFSASSFSSKWNASGQIPERAVRSGMIGFYGSLDPQEGGNTARRDVSARFTRDLGKGYKWNNQVYFVNYDFELYSNFTFFLRDTVNGDQVRQKEARNILGYSTRLSHSGYKHGKRFTTEAGAAVRYDRVSGSELSGTKNRTILIERMSLGDIRELNLGFWISETVGLTDRISANLGLRWDQFYFRYTDQLRSRVLPARAGIISPKFNLYYHLSDNTQLYFSAGKGFHSNDARSVGHADSRKMVPPAWAIDLGMVWKPVSNLFLQGAIWHLRLDQEFTYTGDEGIVEPNGRSKRLGVDLTARYQPLCWLFFDADFNYAHGRSVEMGKGENFLPLAPVLTSSGGISFRSHKGWNAGIRYRYMGDRPANETNSVVAGGYFLTDAMISFETKRFETGITARNLMNVKWKETQFNTESKLKNENSPVSEIHFTPGNPFLLNAHVSVNF